MFANFTEETCTGTGATLALAGVTTGNIAFSKSFADGDLVAYVVEDSGGTIKVAGVGTYVSATDDITRSDTWNWNGTVIDDNPATNITLSGGTHTIRVDITAREIPYRNIYRPIVPTTNRYIVPIGVDGSDAGSPYTPALGEYMHVLLSIPAGATVDSLTLEVTTGQPSALARVGLVSINRTNGEPLASLAETIDIDVSAAGVITQTFTDVYFPVETVVYAWLGCDTASVAFQAWGRNDYNSNTMIASATASNQRSYPMYDKVVASGRPAYGAIADLDAVGNASMPVIIAHYN